VEGIGWSGSGGRNRSMSLVVTHISGRLRREWREGGSRRWEESNRVVGIKKLGRKPAENTH
jgi:hypothetical protein